MDEATILYRPVGANELRLIAESGYTAFPPRLAGQTILYPVQFPVQKVGSAMHLEYWIPVEKLSEFNQNIVDKIEVISEFHGK